MSGEKKNHDGPISYDIKMVIFILKYIQLNHGFIWLYS